MDLKKTILKYALQNAIKFNGKANVGAVIGKVFAEDPNLKEKAAFVSKEVQKVIKEISKLNIEEQKQELKKIAPKLLKKKKRKRKR